MLVDANVLYSGTLRSWLFHLKLQTGGGMFALWTTEDVMSEVTYRFRRNNPRVDGKRITNIRKQIKDSMDDVVEDFDGSIQNPFEDPNDSHLHAAAASSGATMLLTDDAKILEADETIKDKLTYEVMNPDQFFVLIDDSGSEFVRRATAEQLKYNESRKLDLKSAKLRTLEESLEMAGCREFAKRVAGHVQSLAGV